MAGKLPVPFDANPLRLGPELTTCHAYVVVNEAAKLLVQVTAVDTPGHRACCNVVLVITGNGFTLIVKVVGTPGHA